MPGIRRARNVVFHAGHALPADVGTPQVGNLVQPTYHSGRLSDNVATGRAKSALNSEQVPVNLEVSEAPQERWSRGCRRAHVSFWFWLRLQLWLLVPKKKSRCPSRSPRKSWTPASTSNLAERACLPWQGGPAPISSAAQGAAGSLSLKIDSFWRPSYAFRANFRVPEEIVCSDHLPPFLGVLPCWLPAPHDRHPLGLTLSTTSSATSMPSASATNRCATRITNRRFARFRVAKTAASRVNSQPSRWLASGRPACRVPTKALTRNPIRNVRVPSTDKIGLRHLCAAAPFAAIRPNDCTDRSLDRC
jgi:hypothetical protein